MFSKLPWFVCFLAFLTGCGNAPADTGERRALALQDTAGLDRMLDDYVAGGAFPFLYARLEDADGTVIYEHAVANDTVLPAGTVIDEDTWIRIWSMSKIVTISTVLDLREEGILSLDDPLSKYIPELGDLQVATMPDGASLSKLSGASWFSDEGLSAASQMACPLPLVPAEREITLRDLVIHEAGFYYATTNIPCLDDMATKANLAAVENSEALIAGLAEMPLIQQPGSGYFYGTNTTVLGLVAERATGKSLKQLVEERVTGPLGIEGLQYDLPDGVALLPRYSGASGSVARAGPGELDIFGGEVPGYAPDRELYLGGEGMLGTADGYSDFLRMLLRRGQLNGYRLLEEDTIAEMTSPQTQLENPLGDDGYNLWLNNGILADGTQGRGGLWIGGGYEGTHFWIDPEYEFTGIVMTQMYNIPEQAWNRDEMFREAVYDRLLVDGRKIR